jgi:methyltransferase (TIGR00027 family)
MHVQVDPPPHVLEDEIGLKLAPPLDHWRPQGTMDPLAPSVSRRRASIVARARFIEDLVVEQAGRGVRQYVILGAGLDTFAQRRPEVASHLKVFEIDRLGPTAWKRQRLIELGFGIPEWLRLVPVDFEAGPSWWEQLTAAGFAAAQPAVVASTGVSMYLTREAIVATLRQVAALASGSTFAMTFIPPLDFSEPDVRAMREDTHKRLRQIGTPPISYFTPEQMVALAREAGLRDAQHVSQAMLTQRYFAGRTDGLRPGSAEEFLVAST